MKNKYRLIHSTSYFLGNVYQPQIKYWWFPFMWFDIGVITTDQSDAINECKIHKHRTLYINEADLGTTQK